MGSQPAFLQLIRLSIRRGYFDVAGAMGGPRQPGRRIATHTDTWEKAIGAFHDVLRQNRPRAAGKSGQDPQKP